MSIGGIWNVTIKTPRGELKPVLALAASKNKITGTIAMPGAPPTDLTQGKLVGMAATMKGRISKPMPATLAFDVKFDGDSLTGTCAAGISQALPVTGVRVSLEINQKGRLARWKDFLFG